MDIPDEITLQALRGFDKRFGYSKLERMRDALEIAAPLLASQPTLPVCPNCEGEHFTCGACGIVLDASVAQPVADREAVEVEVCKVIADFFRDDEGFTSYHASSLTARLLPLLTGSGK